jgi:hypothetical protein
MRSTRFPIKSFDWVKGIKKPLGFLSFAVFLFLVG